MAITKEKKEQIVSKLKDIFENATSIAFVNFHGLNVDDTTAMRGALRDSGVSYYVAKKSLIHRALADTSFEGEAPALDGEIAIAYSDDETGSAREIYEFQKKYKENIALVGGVFEKKLLSKEEITEIAQIPGLDVLRGQFVQIINSPISGFARVINAIAESKA